MPFLVLLKCNTNYSICLIPLLGRIDFFLGSPSLLLKKNRTKPSETALLQRLFFWLVIDLSAFAEQKQ
jgi:hypothetical protein